MLSFRPDNNLAEIHDYVTGTASNLNGSLEHEAHSSTGFTNIAAFNTVPDFQHQS